MNPSSTPAKVPSETRVLVEAIVASTVGTTIEWYDFFLYGTAAALVFPRLFFPGHDPFLGQVLSFGTFTIGFVARPVGGVVFGYLGDRLGRKSTLVATLLLMGVSTLLIGFLPTYAALGPAAAVLLTALRFAQGLGVGGEWGGAVLLALEAGSRGRRGFHASWPQAGVPLGLLTSTLVLSVFQGALSEEEFLAWGWRVPFLLSALLIGVGLLIRARVAESPLFAKLRARGEVARAPVSEAIRAHWREIVLAAGSRLVENSCFYLFTAYAIAYGKTALAIDTGVLLRAVNVAAAVEFFAIPAYGFLSDVWSRRGLYAAGCLFVAAFALPYYALLETRDPLWVTVAVVLSLAGGHALLYSVQASLIPELFGTRLRYSGASLGYQLASPLAGGLAPLVAAWLVNSYPGQSWPLAEYVIVLAVISLACVWLLAETSRKDIDA